MQDPLVIAEREFGSRLLVGTGKYDSFETMRDAVLASRCELVTVAVRRIDLDAGGEDITSFLPENTLLLPNTSGAETAEEAIRIARLARAGGLPDKVRPGSNCWLVAPGDATAHAGAIREAVAVRMRLPHMGERSRTIVQQEFSWTTLVEAYLTLYDELLRNTGR